MYFGGNGYNSGGGRVEIRDVQGGEEGECREGREGKEGREDGVVLEGCKFIRFQNIGQIMDVYDSALRSRLS